jgi:hypothetical protein
MHRDSPGWKGTHYKNDTGRNDIIISRVARDGDNLYFYVETAAPLSPETDPGWMRLFIDADRDEATGWEGYDFVVNRKNPAGKAVVEKSEGGWSWTKVGEIDFVVNRNAMELKIPRSILGLVDNKVDIEFKWSDNMQEDGDIMDFWVNGDVAPSGRFNYRYAEK